MLDDLPREILLTIFEQGGLPFLVGGPADTCTKLRDISLETGLWKQSLSLLFHECGMYAHEVDAIPDIREWYSEQVKLEKTIVSSLNRLVHESLRPSSRSAVLVEAAAANVIKHRLRAVPVLKRLLQEPRSLAHYHWALWMLDVTHRMEGVQRLLDLSTKDTWGNDPVANPIEQVIALQFLRTDLFPRRFMDVMYVHDWVDLFDQYAESNDLNNTDADVKCDWIISRVNQLDAGLAKKSDFYSTLLKSSLFTFIGRQLDLDARLLSYPMSTFCCVNKGGNNVVFVDFSRGGKLRTIEEIQDRLSLSNTPGTSVRYGISFYDVLATTYVWHTMPSPTNRKTALDLIQHAALDAKVHKGRHFPGLYSSLVRRMIAKNIHDVDDIANMGSAVIEPDLNESKFEVGQVCRLVGGPPGPEFCVIVEVASDSCSVIRGSNILRVLPAMLVRGFDGDVTKQSGLIMPDIEGLDMSILGEHFMHYDPENQVFTNDF